ncbi:hypothetical protein [Flavobacterium sp. KACC 22761]|uniref:hypothetical protein n=1 Tax=Flavobacterium sp. KACC 22761 TaxID=3092665 RepID=UPI002A75632C|nr:hypothetical protein [Flavobacterium sp. KACC 22761]WPO78434.1 hypothetical protein SCB73_19425 [Flavobacterium sp. KACC 22761]
MIDILHIHDGTKIKLIILVFVLFFCSFYFLKKYKSPDWQAKILLIIGITGPIWLIYYEIKRDFDVQLLSKDFALTTGKIDKYFIPNIKGSIPSIGKSADHNYIEYSYVVNNIVETNSYDENYFIKIPNEKPNLNISYLVLYERNNPKNSFILINYPINNLNDLNMYKKKFEHGIPDDAFELK